MCSFSAPGSDSYTTAVSSLSLFDFFPLYDNMMDKRQFDINIMIISSTVLNI